MSDINHAFILNCILSYKLKKYKRWIDRDNVNLLYYGYPPIYYITNCKHKNPIKLISYLLHKGCDINIIINFKHLIVHICEKLVELENPYSGKIIIKLLDYIHNLSDIYFDNNNNLAHFIFKNHKIFGYKILKKLCEYPIYKINNMDNLVPFDMLYINNNNNLNYIYKRTNNMFKFINYDTTYEYIIKYLLTNLPHPVINNNKIIHKLMLYYHLINPSIFEYELNRYSHSANESYLKLNDNNESPLIILVNNLLTYNEQNIDNLVYALDTILKGNNLEIKKIFNNYIYNPRLINNHLKENNIGIIHNLCSLYTPNRHKLIEYFESYYGKSIYNVLNFKLKIPLHYTLISNYNYIFQKKFLTEKNVQMKYKNNNTILHYLCSISNYDDKIYDLIKHLICDYNVDINFINYNYQTPLDLVDKLNRSNDNLVLFLINKGGLTYKQINAKLSTQIKF